MLADVVLLRAKGKRLKRRELQPPTRGTLSIKCDDGQGSFKRPLLVARLWLNSQARGCAAMSLCRLFDVRLVVLEDGVLTVSGIELGRWHRPAERRTVQSTSTRPQVAPLHFDWGMGRIRALAASSVTL